MFKFFSCFSSFSCNSCFRKRPRRDSNPRHQASEACALSWLSYWSTNLFPNIIGRSRRCQHKRAENRLLSNAFGHPSSVIPPVVGVVPDPDTAAGSGTSQPYAIKQAAVVRRATSLAISYTATGCRIRTAYPLCRRRLSRFHSGCRPKILRLPSYKQNPYQ